MQRLTALTSAFPSDSWMAGNLSAPAIFPAPEDNCIMLVSELVNAAGVAWQNTGQLGYMSP